MKRNRRNRIKYTPSEHCVHIGAALLTCFWIFTLFFPIYWCVITSMKDSADALKDPPSFVPTTPYEYGIVLEYSAGEWAGMSKRDFQEDANIVLWSAFRESANGRMGITKVYAVVDGAVQASARLRKSAYTLNVSRIWDATLSLKPESIVERLDEAATYNCVSYNVADSVPDNGFQNETTESLTGYFAGIQDSLHGRVTKIFAKNNIWTFAENYIAAWNYPQSLGMENGLLQAVGNSLIISLGAVLGNWIVCGLAGFCLSKLLSRRWGRRFLLFFFLTSMVPSTVTTITTYLLLENVGMSTNMLGVILPMWANPTNIMLFKGFFDGVPTEMLEAARIDGAGELGIFGRICLPVSRPIFMTIGLLTFPIGFSDVFWSSIILRERSQFTVPLVSRQLLGNSGAAADYTMMMAFSLIVSVPTILVMIAGQKDLNRGMNFSGLKG